MDYTLINHPLITVLMPVYNGESFLTEAIDSILSQTFTDLEFLIIDDGSKDSSPLILAAYAQKDRRVRITRNPTNIGLTRSLNKGLDLAQGQYIARMDADDINHPDRIRKQVAFLDTHPEVGICGTWIQLFGNGPEEMLEYPADSSSIKSLLLFHSPLAHPSVMARRDLFLKHGIEYSCDYPCAEDYELWVRCSKYTEFANLPEVLLYYRLHSAQETQKNAGIKTVSTEKIRLNQIKDLGINPTDEELALHSSLARFSYVPTWCFMEKSHSWLHKLYYANLQARRYPEEVFSRMLADRWFDICYNARNLGFRTFVQFMMSPLQQHTSLKSPAKLKFGLKSLMRM